MTNGKKIKTIDNKIEEDKAQYNLDRQTDKISTSSSRNICKYDFLTGKDALPEQDLLEKATTIKRFEYSSLRKYLIEQTDIEKKQYQKLDDTLEFHKIIKKKQHLKAKVNQI